MAFDQTTFALVGAHSADTPKLYSYKTIDSLATVTASGYFNQKRFELSPGDIILNDISGSFHIIQVLTATPTVVTSQEQFRIPTKQLTINKLSEFPAASGGVITLDDDTFYLIGDNLTDSSDRWQLGQDTVIAGLDSSVSSLTYIGTGDMFTAVDTSNKITLLTLSCPNGTLHNITKPGAGVAVFQLINCTIDSCDIVGVLDNLNAIQYTDVAFNDVKTDGITFAGIIPVFIGNTDLVTVNGSSAIFFDLGTAVFDTFSYDASFLTLAAGATFLSGLTGSGNISAGNSGTITGVKTFGVGTPLAGITVDDIRWEFFANDDIADTRPDGFLSLTGNAAETVIANPSSDGTNAVLVAGTWAIERTSRFTGTAAGRLTYNGIKDLTVPIIIPTNASAASGTNKDINFYVYINGVIRPTSKTRARVDANDVKNQTVIWQETLSTGDFIEIFVENSTDSINLIVEDAKMVVN